MPKTWIAIYNDLVLQLKQFFREAGYSQAIIGLSGGFDSALVAAIACDALGRENVLAVYLPMEGISSDESREAATQIVANLGCAFDTINIKPVVDQLLYSAQYMPRISGVDLPLENVQARARGTILMTLANELDRLVLATGNLSEALTGYCTIYGDTVGAVEVIGCLFKTEAYKVGRAYNEANPAHPLPEQVFTRKPTAELRVGQFDENELPPYDLLDQVLYFLHFQFLSEDGFLTFAVEQCGLSTFRASEIYRQVKKLMKVGAWKMRQCPPMLDVHDLPGRPSSIR